MRFMSHRHFSSFVPFFVLNISEVPFCVHALSAFDAASVEKAVHLCLLPLFDFYISSVEPQNVMAIRLFIAQLTSFSAVLFLVFMARIMDEKFQFSSI